MLLEAKRGSEGPFVHIIRNGTCSNCGGTCKGEISENDIFIIDDIPKNYKLPETSIFKTVKMESPEYEDTETGNMTGLTTEEKEAVTITLTGKEKEAIGEHSEIKKKYRKMFGYG